MLLPVLRRKLFQVCILSWGSVGQAAYADCGSHTGLDKTYCMAVGAVEEGRPCEELKGTGKAAKAGTKDPLVLPVCQALANLAEGRSCDHLNLGGTQARMICTEIYIGMNGWKMELALNRETSDDARDDDARRISKIFALAKKSFFELGQTLNSENSPIKGLRAWNLVKTSMESVVDSIAHLPRSAYCSGPCSGRAVNSNETLQKQVEKNLNAVASLTASKPEVGSLQDRYSQACLSLFDLEHSSFAPDRGSIPEACAITKKNREKVLNLALSLFQVIKEREDQPIPTFEEVLASSALLVNYLEKNEKQLTQSAKWPQAPVIVKAGTSFETDPAGQRFHLPFLLNALPSGEILIELSEWWQFRDGMQKLSPLGRGGFKTVYNALDYKSSIGEAPKLNQLSHRRAISHYSRDAFLWDLEKQNNAKAERLRQKADGESEVAENVLAIKDPIYKWKALVASVELEARQHAEVSKVDRGFSAPLKVFRLPATANPEKVLIVQETYAGDLHHLIGELKAGRGGCRGRTSTQIRTDLSVEIVQAMAKMHSKNYVHRDLKPGNILISKDAAGCPHAAISDFGLALNLKSPRSVEDSPMAGTLSFLSPEAKQAFTSKGKILKLAGIQADVNSSKKNDVYALGKILEKLWDDGGKADLADLNNRTTVRDEDDLNRSSIPTIRENSGTPPGGISPIKKEVNEVISKMMASNPYERVELGEILPRVKGLRKPEGDARVAPELVRSNVEPKLVEEVLRDWDPIHNRNEYSHDEAVAEKLFRNEKAEIFGRTE